MKPSIPKGTRDFSPVEMVRRNFIFDTIKTVYQKFGFQQIETPAMENLSTLEGKYGEEGDKLLFRILNSGPVLEEIQSSAHPHEKIRNSDITEKGLRYDLTVPFARYVVMHQNEITFPFKRYQMQPVWRADRPQKGRYREFYQCDADVIGSTSLLNEVELIQIIDEVFAKLGVGVVIKFNNRKILAGIIEFLKIEKEKSVEFITILDKIEKIGIDAATLELLKLGLSINDIEAIKHDLLSTDLNIDTPHINLRIESLKKIFLSCNSEIGLKGIEEVEKINLHLFGEDGSSRLVLTRLQFDTSLARGLNYYTGAILEVKVNNPRSTFTSSICGGGRYDDLTGIFGLPYVSGVGISFGVDRIYDVMDEMKLFDELKLSGATTKILFVNFGNEEEKYCLSLLKQIREAGINAEIYPDAAKMKKQMSYADDNRIPFVCLVGSDEMKSGQLTLKNMISGEQEKITIEEMIVKLLN